METNGKSLILQRTLGAVVLIAAAATLVPLVLDGQGLKAGREQVQIPDEPTFELKLDDQQQPQVRMLQAKGAVNRTEQEAVDAVTMDASASSAEPVGEPANPPDIGVATSVEETPLGALPSEPTAAGQQNMEDIIQKITQTSAETVKPVANNTPVAPTSQPASLGGDVADAWTIQMGAFKDRGNAQKVISQLMSKGYRAYLGSQTPGVYRVFVGPEIRRDRADQMREKVAADTGTRGVVVRYIP